MYKNFIIFILFFMCVFKIFAGDFSPTVLTITGQDILLYRFEGGNLNIPVTINGHSASVWLVINTKEQASRISKVRNGNLGWHYVNKIDTTVYISERNEMAPGTSNIVWSGRDQDGNFTENGDYYYYLWAYDSKTPRQKACSFLSTGYGSESQFVNLVERGTDGYPLAKPILFGSQVWQSSQANPGASDYFYKAHGTMFKWSLGSDPDDITMLQTTRCPGYGDTATDLTYGGPVLNPTNFNIFYQSEIKKSEEYRYITTVLKWDFVSGGMAVQDERWGGWENIALEDSGTKDIWSQKPSCYTDGNYIYQLSPGINNKSEEWNKLRVYNYEDGAIFMDKMMHEWYMPDDKNPKGWVNASFDKMYSRYPYSWLLISHYSCMHEMINTTRLVVDQDDETDMIMWRNSNGDYFLDTAYSPAYEPQWYCLTDDMTDTMRPSSVSIDRNGFNIIGVSYYGLTSFAVSTQDGAGIGCMQFADDKPGNEKFPKLGGVICDNGSAYDGIYFANVESGNDTWVPVEKVANSQYRKAMSSQHVYTSYVAFDSFKGVIISCCMKCKDDELKTYIDTEKMPFQFSVSQNSPNPFNPSTVIDIELPSRNIVKAEVYNVTGGKVTVLANGVLDTGSHRLKWDARGFSAGVYFCRISYGTITKTIRMTLVK